MQQGKVRKKKDEGETRRKIENEAMAHGHENSYDTNEQKKK